MTGASFRRVRLACLATLSAAAIAASGVDAPAIRGLSLDLGNGATLSVGAVRTDASLLGAAIAQSGETVTLENVVLDFGSTTYRLPKAEFVGSNLGRSDLAAVFAKDGAEPLAARLARVSAQRVVIPELVIEQRTGRQVQASRYRNVVASGVAAGRVASIASEGAVLEITGRPEGTASGAFGRVLIEELDLAGAVALYTERSPADDAPMRPIYRGFSLENLALKDPQGVEVRIARVAGRDFLARPTRQSWAEMTAALEALGAKDKPGPEETARSLAAMADLFAAFQVGSMEATGFEVRDPSGKDAGTGRIARLAYRGAASGQPPEARVEGFEAVSDEGKVRVGNIAFEGFSFENTLKGLKALGPRALDTLSADEARALIPTIGTMRMSNLGFEEGAEAGKAGERQSFQVGALEMTADRPVNGVPTNIRLGVDRLSFSVPPKSQEEGLKELAALGYKAVDLSFLTAAVWNEAAQEIAISEMSLRGAEMGSVTVRGILGNVPRDAFNPDSAVAMVALIGATAKTLDVTVENRGLLDRLIEQEARKQKKKPEEVRREYGMAAAVVGPTMLGNSPSAKALGQALARFVAKPGRLVIQAKAKDPAGVGLADMAMLGEPAAILERLDVTAKAE